MNAIRRRSQRSVQSSSAIVCFFIIKPKYSTPPRSRSWPSNRLDLAFCSNIWYLSTRNWALPSQLMFVPLHLLNPQNLTVLPSLPWRPSSINYSCSFFNLITWKGLSGLAPLVSLPLTISQPCIFLDTLDTLDTLWSCLLSLKSWVSAFVS